MERIKTASLPAALLAADLGSSQGQAEAVAMTTTGHIPAGTLNLVCCLVCFFSGHGKFLGPPLSVCCSPGLDL